MIRGGVVCRGLDDKALHNNQLDEDEGGVCVTHGAMKKRCSFEGCTKYVVKEGVCITHGTKIKSCSSKGCTNGVAKVGVCCMHGSKSINTNNISTIQSINRLITKKRRNLIVGYGSLVAFQGITWSEVMRCSFERCSNGVVKKGVCSTHGATRKRYPQKGGVCITHGAKVKRCSFEDKVPWIVKRGF